MELFKIGDLFTIKCHPYQFGATDVLMGANATFIPPILVAIEVRNFNNQHDTETGIKESQQIKGIFYSHKSHKYEQHWFKMEEIKLIESTNNGEGLVMKDKAIKALKADLQFKQVILKSIDVELEKKKLATESKNLEQATIRQSSYLDFVPPPMHILDVKDKEMKDNYFKNNGGKKVDFSSIEVKCKWYNPNICSYSEEWIAIDALKKISPECDIKVQASIGKYFLYPSGKETAQDNQSLEQTHSIIKTKQILFNHYQYQIIAEDIIRGKLLRINLSETDLFGNEISIDDIFGEILPDHLSRKYTIEEEDFSLKNLYRIVYISDRNQVTNRFIYVIAKHPFQIDDNKNDTILIAHCLLRGEIRHFKVSNIKGLKKVKEGLVHKLFSAMLTGDASIPSPSQSN